MKERAALLRIALAGAAVGTIALVGAGVASSSPGGRQANDGSRPPGAIVNDKGWLGVGAESGDEVVGWVDQSRPLVFVSVPDARRPDQRLELGVQLVLDDGGKPIGVLGPSGYLAGGVTADGALTDEGRARVGTASVVSRDGGPGSR